MGSNENFKNVLAASGATIEEKKLRQLPAFESGEELFGAVFVHGSGDCDQLGLGQTCWSVRSQHWCPAFVVYPFDRSHVGGCILCAFLRMASFSHGVVATMEPLDVPVGMTASQHW